MMFVIGLLAVASLTVPVFDVAYGAVAKLTVHVMDMAGNPVSNAAAGFGFYHPSAREAGTYSVLRECRTNTKGYCSRSDKLTEPYVIISVEKEGYYFSSTTYEPTEVHMGRWQPWNPTIEIVLKKKRNPVPMYAKKTDWIKVPVLEEPVGYDLEAGDWVAPHGAGKEADFVITLFNNDRTFHDYDTKIVLKFSNPGDGILLYRADERGQSYYKWPFAAPERAYANYWSAEVHKKKSEAMITTLNDSDWFMFRVRSVLDENENIISAKYGKLKGPIDMSPSGKISFVYYFNPDGTRNLEFDPKRNLFDWSGRDAWKHRVTQP